MTQKNTSNNYDVSRLHITEIHNNITYTHVMPYNRFSLPKSFEQASKHSVNGANCICMPNVVKGTYIFHHEI